MPRVRASEPALLFLGWAALYVAVAGVLVYGLGLVLGDAWTRVGNASYVLLSRDPHAAAIGFVWNPLPSLLALPLVAFYALWPGLVHDGFAANLVSAPAMAVALVQLNGLLADGGLGRVRRLTVVGAVALNPVILYYAANGMSEALFLAALLYATRHLARWLRRPTSASLVRIGLALAIGYLVRYEAIAAASCVIAIVALCSWRRSRPGDRGAVVVADSFIVGLPVAAAFATWTLTSWIVTGSPFETFTSVYGNTSQTVLMAPWIAEKTGQGTSAAVLYLTVQLMALGPGLLFAPAVLVAHSRVGRASPTLVAALPLLAVLAFSGWAFLSGRSFGWLRFEIAAIPLAAIVAAELVRHVSWPHRERIPQALRVGAMAALAWSAVPTTTWVITQPSLAQEESRQLVPYIAAAAGARAARPIDAQIYALGGELATVIDGLGAPDGAVLVDAATTYPLVLRSSHPKQFVIPSDRDFRAALANPAAFGVRYFVVPLDAGLGTLDAINRAHPGAYADGAGLGRLVGTVESSGLSWRVYVLTDSE